MGTAIQNESVFHVWDLGTTGKTGTMTATLTRFPTTTTSEAATETVSINEIGVSGVYTFQYTPTLAYTYHLKVAESTLFAEKYYEDDVAGAATSVTVSGAYCTEAHVVAFVQIAPDYTGSTTPDETEVTTFMTNRAAQIYSWMVDAVGSSAPGPASFSSTIDTSSDKGLALSRLCSMANALGAAADTLYSSGAGTAPARSERGNEYLSEFLSMQEAIMILAEQYVGSAAVISNHYVEGRITPETLVSRTSGGLTFTGDTEW